MTRKIDETEHYNILDESWVCCDEHQFKFQCKSCDEIMECQFCCFDPYDAHGCDRL